MKIPGFGRFTWRQDKEGLIIGFLLFFILAIIPVTAVYINNLISAGRDLISGVKN